MIRHGKCNHSVVIIRIDQRIRDIYVTREISIGDYVLSGGELPAAVLVDAIVRLIPGVLNDETSALVIVFRVGCLTLIPSADYKGTRCLKSFERT
ncbi:hypothetical protein CS542_01455 [Pedobacter sp. IW39]|nr:hypothetical protein CS542_01455 [Pedobacter sp. IW39]